MSVKLSLINESGVRYLKCEKGQRLLDVLRDNSIETEAACGGQGRCKKCRVRLDGREVLSCRTFVEKDCEIELIADGGKYLNKNDFALSDKKDIKEDDEFSIAIDLGTTTITAAAVDLRTMKTVSSRSCLNHQKIFGSDVISRIDAAISGKDRELRNTVQKDILSLLERIVSELDTGRDRVREIVVSANTTMMHLLMGRSCEGLSTYPFSPVNIEYEEAGFEEVFQATAGFSAKVILLPGVSAFVGSDIVSGIYFIGMHESDEIIGFIDLGTNAEMAIGNRRTISVGSAAAGPAFEGGNISMGMAGVEGAVSDVYINPENGDIRLETIGDTKPKGICGTGLISAAASMLRAGILTSNGSFNDKYAEKGFILSEENGRKIKISQEDIHNFLLAKAAVAGGFKTIAEMAGIDCSDISGLYLAGSFAQYLKIEDAVRTGLIGRKFEAKTFISGNSSLEGAVKFIRNCEGSAAEIEKIVSKCKVRELSEADSFEKNFFAQMDFIDKN